MYFLGLFLYTKMTSRESVLAYFEEAIVEDNWDFENTYGYEDVISYSERIPLTEIQFITVVVESKNLEWKGETKDGRKFTIQSLQELRSAYQVNPELVVFELGPIANLQEAFGASVKDDYVDCWTQFLQGCTEEMPGTVRYF